jgi:Fe-S-cluster containining protein
MTSQPRWTQQMIADESRRAASAALAADRTPDGLAAMGSTAAAQFDRVWRAIGAQVEAKGPPFACPSGCSWCCYQPVTVALPEAIAIAEHVRATFTAPGLTALKARLAALDDRAHRFGAFARGYLKTACAFLVDGKCSIYAARPVRCRSVYSRDGAHCRWVTENPDLVYAWRDRILDSSPYPPEAEIVADAVLAGVAAATRDAGLAAEPLDLIAALRIALETSEVAEGCLRGEPVFAAATAPDSPEAGLAAAVREVPR